MGHPVLLSKKFIIKSKSAGLGLFQHRAIPFNLGIGTTGPNSALDVNGQIRAGAGGLFFSVVNEGYIDTAGGGWPIWIGKTNAAYTDIGNGALHVKTGGNVGIGTTGPGAKLQISKDDGGNGSVDLSDYGMVTTASGGQATLGAEYIGDGYANLNLGSNISGTRRFWHISKRLGTSPNLDYYYYTGAGFSGPFFTFTTGGNFTATGTKSFEIDHPTKPGMKLVHASVEGPEAGVYYRGETKLIKGQATVLLPDYFEALTRKEGRTVQLTAKGSQPFLLSTTGVSHGQFKVFGNKTDGEFFWEVKAVRQDVDPLRVEKPKDLGAA